ncbi:MAG TPA: metal ABC transporter ATP-binding protein [Patescibacteria group bacterium]|nr:metal ABC transporter ATP-binding protein [Patescibacteria group bacterium]
MPANPIIEIEKLHLELGGRAILDDITISINEGEFIAILGPNGAGKSTLLKLLLGLYKPTSGSIKVLGKRPHTGNNEIGYAPQHRTLESDLALRARDVVGFGLDGNKWGIGFPDIERTKKIDKALEEVDMLRLADMPVGKLSGGEQQRLLIAQALLTNPKILFLDEPLSNLDISHAQVIVTLLTKIARSRNITTLLVTHDVNPLLSTIDKVVYVANGHAAIGKPQDVITSKQLSELYGSEVEVINTKGRIFVLGEEN